MRICFGFLSSACRAATLNVFGKVGDKDKSPLGEISGSLESCSVMVASLAVDLGVDSPATAAAAFSCHLWEKLSLIVFDKSW